MNYRDNDQNRDHGEPNDEVLSSINPVEIGRLEPQLQTKKKSHFVKHRRDAMGVKGTLQKILINNEIRVNLILNQNIYKTFKYPKMNNFIPDEKIVFDLIIGEPSNHRPLSNLDFFPALAEFNNSKTPPTNDTVVLLNRIRKLTISNFPLLIIRDAFKVTQLIGVTDLLRIILLVLYCTVNQQKFPSPLLLHKDIKEGDNILRSNDGEIYLLDYELANEEYRWIMLDIVDLTYDRDKLGIEGSVINKYLNCLNAEHRTNINLCLQLRMAVLRKALYNIRKPNLRPGHLNFMKEVILEEKAFNSWLYKNGIDL